MMCEIKGKTSVKFAVKVISMVKDLNLPKGDVRFQYDRLRLCLVTVMVHKLISVKY